MNLLVKYILLISLFAAHGCATVRHNYTPQAKNLDYPGLNIQSDAYVGEEMMIQGMSIAIDALNICAHVDGACYDIPSGTYKKIGDDGKRQFFSHVGDGGTVIQSGLCDPVAGLFVPRDEHKVCVSTIYGGYSCYEANFNLKKINVASPEAIQRTLIYSGKDKNKLNFLYTEKNGMQTIFSHDVSYDMEDSMTIGYRGARIKILNATNESITYIVLKNFPDR